MAIKSELGWYLGKLVSIFDVIHRAMKISQISQQLLKFFEVVLIIYLVDRIIQLFLVWLFPVPFCVVMFVVNIVDRVCQLLQVFKLV